MAGEWFGRDTVDQSHRGSEQGEAEELGGMVASSGLCCQDDVGSSWSQHGSSSLGTASWRSHPPHPVHKPRESRELGPPWGSPEPIADISSQLHGQVSDVRSGRRLGIGVGVVTQRRRANAMSQGLAGSVCPSCPHVPWHHQSWLSNVKQHNAGCQGGQEGPSAEE